MAQEVMMGDVPAISTGHEETDEIADPHPVQPHVASKDVLGRAEFARNRDAGVGKARPRPFMGPIFAWKD